MRGPGIVFENLRIDFERGLVFLPAFCKFVLGEQVGAEVLENQGGIRIDFQRLAIHFLGVVIFLQCIVDRAEIVQDV